MLLWRVLRGRPRLSLSGLFGLSLFPILPGHLSALLRGLIAWDAGCLMFLGLSAFLFSGERHMADDAAAQEEGEWTAFWVVICAAIASFAGILATYSASKTVTAEIRTLHIVLMAATLLLSWLATHTLFALRYAHEYYSVCRTRPGIEKGLDFPGDHSPDYWDFFYFSLVLGMTFQVSDVQITSRKLRRLATAHGLLSFLFDTVIVALTVNIAASLLGG